MHFKRHLHILTVITLLIPGFSFSNEGIEEAINRVNSCTPIFGIKNSDLQIKPGWDLPHTIPLIESLFSNSDKVSREGSSILDRVEKSTTTSDIVHWAHTVLNKAPLEPSLPAPFSFPQVKKLPPELPPLLSEFLGSLHQAHIFLSRAVRSLTPEQRNDLLRLADFPLDDAGTTKEEISSRRIKKQFLSVENFSQDNLLYSGTTLFAGLDRLLPRLMASTWNMKKKIRIKTTEGDLLIGSSGNDRYTEKELQNVTLLFDPGGKNTYLAPVARASEDQIRIVIDLGDEIIIDTQKYSKGSVGSGILGIGVMILPRSGGKKIIHSSHFSQGCGIGGIGALLINGQSELTGERYTQGFGFFGLGLLLADQADHSQYTATRMGQGAANTRGIGLFRHRGHDSIIKGGLVEPDPREPQGSVSMCQGVGFGPRAYAGGGLGVASIAGDNNKVFGSYFSQGVGYWHSWGLFRMQGHKNLVQARRYDMGTGVHSAFGHFELLGNKNRLLNWGVGPAYGWDHSIGSAYVVGDDNEFQVDWAAGVANIGSISRGFYKTNRSRFRMNNLGQGQYSRNEASYSIHVIDGEGNKMETLGTRPYFSSRQRLIRNMHGILEINGAELVEKLNLDPPNWPELPQEKEIKMARINLESVLQEAPQKSPLEEVSDMVDVAAAFSLDKQTPRKSLEKLYVLPPEKAALLPTLLDPAAVDQMIQLSVIFPANGDPVAKSILESQDNFSLQKKSILIHMLRNFRPSTVVPTLLNWAATHSEQKIRWASMRTLGYMLNFDEGQEPGLRACLRALRDAVRQNNSTAQSNADLFIQRLTLSDATALLQWANAEITPEDRLAFLASCPVDVTSNVGEKAAQNLFHTTQRNALQNVARMELELNTLEKAQDQVRQLAHDVLVSTTTADIVMAITTLGQISKGDDIPLLTPYLHHDHPLIQESAAVALGRMGEQAHPLLLKILKTGTKRERLASLMALPQNSSLEIMPLIKAALNNTDRDVRLKSTGLFPDLTDRAKETKKRELEEAIQARYAIENDAQVKFGLSLLLTLF